MKNFNYLLLLLGLISFSGVAQIEVPTIVANGTVLQREENLNLTGTSRENGEISLMVDDQKFTSETDAEGRWKFEIPPQQAGGPHQLSFYTRKDTLVLTDIYFGDVFLCSGQSNMELNMERVSPLYPEIIADSENEKIRHFLVPDDFNFKGPSKDLPGGTWKAANPENIKEFSAVAYFFAREIHKHTNVPIGLINSAVGGSPASAWLGKESLKKFPELYEEHLKFESDSLVNAINEENRKNSVGWNETLTERDKGFTSDYLNEDPSDWKSTEIPGYWEEKNMLDSAGVIWYKKEIFLSEKPKEETAELNLGRLIDSDQAYINGTQVGATGYQYPPRRYEFDAEILKEGKNSITVRLVNDGGQAGFVEEKPYFLKVNGDSLNLKGEWKYKVGATMPNRKGEIFIRWKPGGLYNAMIAPLHDFKIKGVLWYQGESDAGNPQKYAELFPELISSWRASWFKPELPFLYVQLPNFMNPREEPGESNWAELREVQRKINDSLSNTGMAVTIDVGEWNDIHPLNKKDVGERLALQARDLIYGENLTASSPQPESYEISGNEVVISFKDVGEGLKTSDSQNPTSFAISQDGETYYWAEAEIVGEDAIKLYSEKVNNPKYVRYAWADNPAKANLYNSQDLPAAPFELNLNNEIK